MFTDTKLMSIRKSFFVLAGVCSALVGLFSAFFHISVSIVNSFNYLSVAGHHWARVQDDAVYRLVQYASTENEAHYQQYLIDLKHSAFLKAARTGTLRESASLYVDGKPVINGPSDFERLKDLGFFIQQYGQQGSLKKVVEKWAEGDNKVAVLSDIADELRENIKKNEMVSEKREYYRIRLERLSKDINAVETDFFNALNDSQSGFSSIMFWLNVFIFALFSTAIAAISYFVIRPILRNLNDLQEVAKQLENGDEVGVLPLVKVPDFTFFIESLTRMRSQLNFEARDRERAQQMAGLGLWKWSPTSYKMIWSKKVFEILNLPAGLGPSYEAFRDRVHPEDRAIFDNILQKGNYVDPKELLVEIRLVCNFAGRWQIRYCHLFVEAQQNEHGSMISGTIQDITEKKNLSNKAS